MNRSSRRLLTAGVTTLAVGSLIAVASPASAAPTPTTGCRPGNRVRHRRAGRPAPPPPRRTRRTCPPAPARPARPSRRCSPALSGPRPQQGLPLHARQRLLGDGHRRPGRRARRRPGRRQRHRRPRRRRSPRRRRAAQPATARPTTTTPPPAAAPVNPAACSTDPAQAKLEPEALQTINARSDDPAAKTAARSASTAPASRSPTSPTASTRTTPGFKRSQRHVVDRRLQGLLRRRPERADRRRRGLR